METRQPEKSKKELCTITVMFPVDTDEEAIAIKKKVQEALKGIVNPQLRFTLTPSAMLRNIKPDGS